MQDGQSGTPLGLCQAVRDCTYGAPTPAPLNVSSVGLPLELIATILDFLGLIQPTDGETTLVVRSGVAAVFAYSHSEDAYLPKVVYEVTDSVMFGVNYVVNMGSHFIKTAAVASAFDTPYIPPLFYERLMNSGRNAAQTMYIMSRAPFISRADYIVGATGLTHRCWYNATFNRGVCQGHPRAVEFRSSQLGRPVRLCDFGTEDFFIDLYPVYHTGMPEPDILVFDSAPETTYCGLLCYPCDAHCPCSWTQVLGIDCVWDGEHFNDGWLFPAERRVLDDLSQCLPVLSREEIDPNEHDNDDYDM